MRFLPRRKVEDEDKSKLIEKQNELSTRLSLLEDEVEIIKKTSTQDKYDITSKQVELASRLKILEDQMVIIKRKK